MSWTVITYLSYLAVSVPLTVWVASTLSRNGVVFLADVFEGKKELVAAINRLLVVGFYLVNLGFVMLYLRLDAAVLGLTGVVETVSLKIGVVMLVLGALHFGNILVFNSIRRRVRLEDMRTAPVPHQTVFTPPPPVQA